MNKWFKENYQVEFVQSDAEKMAFDIWLEYYRACEAFDQQVCSGRLNGIAIPLTPDEFKAVNLNAKEERNRALLRLKPLGLDWKNSMKIREKAARYAFGGTSMTPKNVSEHMPCGHEPEEVETADEGTSYCRGCEREARMRENVSEAKVTEADKEAAKHALRGIVFYQSNDKARAVLQLSDALAQRHADGIREGVEQERRKLEDAKQERDEARQSESRVRSEADRIIDELNEEIKRLREQGGWTRCVELQAEVDRLREALRPVEDVRGEICRIISAMLDNPDKYGIFPTGKCYDELEALCQRVRASAERKAREEKDRYRKALEFYANEKNYDETGAPGFYHAGSTVGGNICEPCFEPDAGYTADKALHPEKYEVDRTRSTGKPKEDELKDASGHHVYCSWSGGGTCNCDELFDRSTGKGE